MKIPNEQIYDKLFFTGYETKTYDYDTIINESKIPGLTLLYNFFEYRTFQ